MDEYVSLLILTYFKAHQEDYSYLQLSKLLGLTIEHLEIFIDNHIESNYLHLKNNMLQLTPKGRLTLVNKEIDFFDFEEDKIDVDCINPLDAWSFDRPYVPDKFTQKL